MQRRAIFLIHLIQDVSVLRPLVFMAARDFGFDTLLLVSTRFIARDASGIWHSELLHISASTGARIEFFADQLEAHRQLTGAGLIFSASESSLPQHRLTNDIFRHAPAGLLKVTVQHGYECVGFRQNADHARSHGQTATFAADLLCAWSPIEELTAMAPSQRPKVVVTGPPAVLQLPTLPVQKPAAAAGLVCENLHSVRFAGGEGFQSEFIQTFGEFVRAMDARGRKVSLRAHPGGQYAIRNKNVLPPNVTIENAPLYRLDLRQFAYGISAPSSVLIDLLLADVPTAVWRDRGGTIDADNYRGLPEVSSAQEWVDFATDAEKNPDEFIARQRRFLADTRMPLEPRDVFDRFADLFRAARSKETIGNDVGRALDV